MADDGANRWSGGPTAHILHVGGQGPGVIQPPRRREGRLRDKYGTRKHVATFNTGDEVYVPNPGRGPKWLRQYSDTAIVVKKLNNVTYVVKSDLWRKKERVLHVDGLRLKTSVDQTGADSPQ